MSAVVRILGLGVILATASLAAPVLAADDSSPANSCASSAQAQSLTGDARKAFIQKCTQSPMPPPKSSLPKSQTAPAKSITAPSGSSTAARSAACSSEADRQGLKGTDRKAFRMNCLAGAAPVSATGTKTQPATPTQQKTDLGVVKDGQQK